MTEGDGRVFLVGERRRGDQGRAPGTCPQCSPGDLSGLHRNRAPGHHHFPKNIFSVQLHAGNTAVIETALALSSWGSQSSGETDPFPESGKSEWAAQKLWESRRNFSPSGWFREGFLKEGGI